MGKPKKLVTVTRSEMLDQETLDYNATYELHFAGATVVLSVEAMDDLVAALRAKLPADKFLGS